MLSISYSIVWAANGTPFISPRECEMKNQKNRQHIELVSMACAGTRDSQKCQDFYKTLDTEDQKKKLTCSKEEVAANVNGSYLGDAAIACATGIIVDPIVAIGTGIGEGIAKI